MTDEAHRTAADIGLPEAKLIIPRRNFLIRALGFTAAGAAVTVPVVTIVSAQDRFDHHLKGLEAAVRDLFPGSPVAVRGNFRDARDVEFYRENHASGRTDAATVMVSAGPRVLL